MLHLVNQTLKVQGLPAVAQVPGHAMASHYSLDHLNPDVPLQGLLDGLRQQPTGRFCLYGPPGTGKSALVRWLAQQLGLPLLVKRASDLLSQWVGGNEKNIARAFEQAKQDDALLLIDEVDTFLQPREHAHSGWEASMVNEMLTQMECFEGLLFATTNLLQGMDAAAMRRFDAKVHLRPPTAEQLHRLLGTVASSLRLAPPSMEDCRSLAGLGITPGDVAVVTRRVRHMPLVDGQALVEAVRAEGQFKPGMARGGIGFV